MTLAETFFGYLRGDDVDRRQAIAVANNKVLFVLHQEERSDRTFEHVTSRLKLSELNLKHVVVNDDAAVDTGRDQVLALCRYAHNFAALVKIGAADFVLSSNVEVLDQTVFAAV